MRLMTRAFSAAACFANAHPRAVQTMVAAIATAAICVGVYGAVSLVALGLPAVLLFAAFWIAAWAWISR